MTRIPTGGNNGEYDQWNNCAPWDNGLVAQKHQGVEGNTKSKIWMCVQKTSEDVAEKLKRRRRGT